MRFSNEYINAVGEVDEILGYISKENISKIPDKLLWLFKEIRSEDYVAHINKKVPLKNQELSDKTKALLAFVYRKYLCDDVARSKFDLEVAENDRRYEEVMQSMYGKDVEDIFNDLKNN